MKLGSRIAAAIVSAIANAASGGSVRTDGSVGAAQNLAGPNFLIPQSLGRLVGANLFQSFGTFSIDMGESATFTTSSAGIANVICRVTGGSPSVIDGLLRLSPASGTPAFWFMNPAGVMFGQGASIDVPGAFHVTTAQYLKFPDGNFYADAAQPSTFSAAAPEAFGFLGNSRASVSMSSGSLLSTPNAPIEIVAGDVSIDSASIQNLAGDVRIVAAGGGAGEIGMSGTVPAASGVVDLFNAGSISTSGRGSAGGNISLSTGNLIVSGNGSGIFSTSWSSADGGGIDVLANGKISMVNAGAIDTDVFGSGSGGAIRITAQSFDIDSSGEPELLTGLRSRANPGSTGRSGDIDISVSGPMTIVATGEIVSDNSSTANAGSISVTAGALTIDPMGVNSFTTGIVTNAIAGTGRGGDIRVAVSGPLVILNGGAIASNAFSAGDAGAIDLSAQSMTVDGGQASLSSGVFSTAREGSTGNAGGIQVAVSGSLVLRNSGGLISEADAAGNAGSIDVAAQSLTIDGTGSSPDNVTGISTNSNDTGMAGSIRVAVAGPMAILSSGTISSDAYGAGNGGSVEVAAQSLALDGMNSNFFTGISSDANPGSTGNAGDVRVTVTGALTLVGGATISSDAYASGNAGSVAISAGSLALDGNGRSDITTGISSDAAGGSTGNAGTVHVSVAGPLTIHSAATISSDTYSTGNAGSVDISAGSLTLVGAAGPAAPFTGISSDANEGSAGNAGQVHVAVSGALSIASAGEISSNTHSKGNAGTVTVEAQSLIIDGQAALGFLTGISSDANTGSTGRAGDVTVAVSGPLTIMNSGAIRSDTFSSGRAGAVTVTAQSLTIDGGGAPGLFTGISSDANPGSTGAAGDVQVNVSGACSIAREGAVSSGTFGSGDAGSIELVTGSLLLDGAGLSRFTGISSQANQGSTGNAGSVRVVVAGQASILSDATVSSSTFAAGNAGTVDLSAGSLAIDGSGTNFATGIISGAYAGSTGNAGALRISVSGLLSATAGGAITSSTFNTGNAGSVSVTAGSLMLDGQGSRFVTGFASQAERGSTGQAGSIEVSVAGSATLLRGGEITSSTLGAGNAGSVNVSADSLTIDPRGSTLLTGITTNAAAGSTGYAGNTTVDVSHELALRSGGQITSSTASARGAAGTVSVTAGTIVVDGADANGIGSTITARAGAGSSGQTGNVHVTATDSITLSNGGNLSIQNDAIAANPMAITPTTLSVSAPVIEINGGRITAASNRDIAASDIDIEVLDRLSMNGGLITTSSNNGNGGPIRIHGPGYAWLIDSQVTTSVAGSTNGNGGDITISLPNLILQNGFIQANTAAQHASGGNVNIDVADLIPEAASLVVGGDTAYNFDPNAPNFNLIQAAAPTGVSGTIDVTAPVFDISGTLVGLNSKVLSGVPLGKTLCDSGSGSSLAQTGRGALPESAAEPLRIATPSLAATPDSATLGTYLPITLAFACK